jgi:RHS repeat-associated protein
MPATRCAQSPQATLAGQPHSPITHRIALALAASALLFVACSALLPSSARAEPLCTDTWIGPSEGSWQTESNWSTGHVPTSSDVACIGSGKTADVSAGTNQAGVLQGEGGVRISGGSLELASALEASNVAVVSMTGGTLAGAGTLNVTSSFAWTGESHMSGPGSTVVKPGAAASIAISGGNGWTFLAGRSLVNEGTMTFSQGRMFLSEGAEIENAATFYDNTGGEILFEPKTGLQPSILNTGTFKRTAGTSTMGVNVPFTNTGNVEVQTGTIQLSAGGSGTGGSWSASAGAQVAFGGGTFSLSGGSVSGAIDVQGSANVTAEALGAASAQLAVSAGSFLVKGGSITAENFSLSGGTLAGAGTLNITKSFSWLGESTMSGSGATVVRPGAAGEIAIGGSNGWSYMRARALVNEGTTTFANGKLFLSEGAEIKNPGTFDANSEFSAEQITFEPRTGASPAIVNTGRFQKTAGTGTTTIEVEFENSGIVQALTGKFHFGHLLTAEAPTQYGGAENPSAPGQQHAECGGAVSCATGNESDTQTDLAVGGRGVGLTPVRYYNSQAGAAGEHGAFGYGWTSSFSDHLAVEPTNKKATLYQANGSTEPFTEGTGGSYSPPVWSPDKLSGSAEAGYTLTLADQTQYRFAGSTGRLESVTDRNGNATTLSYSEAGQLEAITDPAGRKLVLKYNVEGLVESAKDPMGHEVKYSYEAGNLASVTEPGETSPRWQFKYDGSHQMTSMTDGRGGKTTREYNAAHQVISETDPMARTLGFEYEAFHTRITNKATGSVNDEYFTSNDEPSSITRGYGTASASTESFAYNEAGYLTSLTDGNGHTTKYGYDGEGNRTSMLDANEHETKWAYDSTHDVISTTTPKGETTTIKRDSHGNPETISRPAPSSTTQTTTYKYDSHGNLESVEDPLKHVWKYEYDNAGDRTAQVDPEGDKRTWAYNEDSQETATVSPRGNVTGGEPAKYTTTIERDERGRPLKVTDPLGHATKYSYDANGNLETVTDPNTHTTTYTYDADNQPTKVKKANGIVTETGYDGAGQVTSQTDGNKRETKYVRNILEQVTEVIDPLGRKTTKEYDAAGSLKALTDPAKRTATYAYDPANRLTEVSYSDGKTHAAKYEYDADGDRTSMVDGTGTTSYTYDQLDRLTESKDGHGDKTSYEYDLANEQTKITYPNGKVVTQGYDKAGRLEKVTDWLEHTIRFANDADSNPSTTTFPTGTSNVDKYGYNEADQMSEVAMTKGAEPLASLAYIRDNDGQLKTTTSKGLPGEEKPGYEYDTNNRLTKAGTSAYEYDSADNPTKIPGSTNTYDNASELKTGTSLTFAYDEMGERTKRTPTSGAATTYGYDEAGNLTSVERPKEGKTAEIKDTYAYDGNGIRASQTISGTTSFLTWNPTGGLPLILNDGTNSYIYGPDGLPVEQVSSGGTVTYLHHDQQGSTRMLTGSTGTVTGNTTFDAYGNKTGSTGTSTTPLGYDGQYTSTDTGLIYLRARTYDSATAQFLSRDPVVGVTRAPYNYAGDNPLNGADPTGLCGAGSVSEFLNSFNPVSSQNCAYQLAQAAAPLQAIFAEAQLGAGSIARLGTVTGGGWCTAGFTGAGGLAVGPAGGAGEILPTPNVSDPKLENIVKNLYKGTANPNRIGNGTTADAIRGEGSHVQKGLDESRALTKWLEANPEAPTGDQIVARSLLQDLLSALAGE